MFFRKKYHYLAIDYPVKIQFGNLIFPSLEHAFIASKLEVIKHRQHILSLDSIEEVRQFGQSIGIRPNWEKDKKQIMTTLQWQKFARNIHLSKRLVCIRGDKIYFDNDQHDNYWGRCHCPECKKIKGKNHLGKILTRVRDNIRSRIYQLD